MDPGSVLLRPARPVSDDGLVYGRYLYDLAPGFRYTLGRNAVEVIASAFVEPGHDLSYQYTTFAEHDGAIVGVVAGYTGEQHQRSVDGGLKRAVGRRGPLGIRTTSLAKWLRYFGPRADDEFYLWVLAVSEEYRSQGIGSLMIEHTEERARAVGATRLSLDTEATNEGARRLYERRGMRVESGWPKLPLVSPVVVRMAKPL